MLVTYNDNVNTNWMVNGYNDDDDDKLTVLMDGMNEQNMMQMSMPAIHFARKSSPTSSIHIYYATLNITVVQ